MIRDNSVIMIVFTKAGTTDAFSELYSSEKSDGVMCGTPLIRIYAIRKISTANVMIAASITSSITTNDPGCFRYVLNLSPIVVLLTILISVCLLMIRPPLQ